MIVPGTKALTLAGMEEEEEGWGRGEGNSRNSPFWTTAGLQPVTTTMHPAEKLGSTQSHKATFTSEDGFRNAAPKQLSHQKYFHQFR